MSEAVRILTMNPYRDLLERIQDHLKKYEVPGWPARLDKWGRELDQPESEKLKAHLLRTPKSLGGMGSISDIVICPEAGYNVPNGESVIKAANDVLLSLVRKLDAEVSHLLSTLPS